MRLRGLPAAVLAAVLMIGPAAAETLVFAAASMKTALEAIGTRYAAETGGTVTFAFAASGALARQLEEGAPAGVFISADEKWMDHAVEKAVVRGESRRIIAGNTLVLVAPADSPAAIDLAPDLDLAGALGDGRLAIGEPRSVPAGTYAKAALEHLGLWASVEAKLAPVENVRAALALVATGEAPFGIVYGTDARVEPKVRVVATFPSDSHPPIVYPAALTAGGDAEAAAFLDWLAGPAARTIFSDLGFSPPGP